MSDNLTYEDVLSNPMKCLEAVKKVQAEMIAKHGSPPRLPDVTIKGPDGYDIVCVQEFNEYGMVVRRPRRDTDPPAPVYNIEIREKPCI